MRTEHEICQDYLQLIRSENKITLSDDEIDILLDSEQGISQIKEKIESELASIELIKGKKVQSVRAFRIFCEIVVGYDVSTGDPVYNSIVKALYEIVEHNTLSNITIRRGGGKTFFACLYSLFKQYTLHHFSIVCSFNVPIMVESFFDVYREIVDENQMLSRKKFKHGKTEIWSSKGCIYNYGRIKSITLGSTSRSKHPNMIIIDDILGKTDSGSKFNNSDVKNFVLADLLPTLDRKRGRGIMLGTIDNTEDIYHTTAYDEHGKFNRKDMMFNSGKEYYSDTDWRCVIFPAVLNFDTEEVLLPEVYNFKKCMADKKRMGDFLWYREMQLEIRVDKSALISEHVFNQLGDENEKMSEEGVPGVKYLIAVDPSSGEGENPDFAAITVVELRGNRRILRYMWHEKKLPIIDPNGGTDDLGHKVKLVWEWFLKSELWVEDNSIGRILIQYLRSLDVEVNEHNTGLDKVAIFSKAIAEIKDTIEMKDGQRVSKVIVPNHPTDEYTQEMYHVLKKEALNYTLIENNGKVTMGGRGTHDDLMTSVLIGLYYVLEESGYAGCICSD